MTTDTTRTMYRLHNALTTEGFMAQADFFAAHHLNHGHQATREDTRAVLADIVATFPDVQFELQHMMISGEWALAYYWFTGTHLGTARHPYVHYGLLRDVPPTGRSMRVHHAHLYRIRNGEIIEHSGTRDDVGMVRQLGLPFTVHPAGSENAAASGARRRGA